MLGTALTAYVAVAHGLGGYNIGRYLLKKGVEKRRERKAQAARDAKVDAIIEDIDGVRTRLYEGKLDPVRAKAVEAAIRAALASEVTE